jgi:hypothetical protein
MGGTSAMDHRCYINCLPFNPMKDTRNMKDILVVAFVILALFAPEFLVETLINCLDYLIAQWNKNG